MDGTTQIMREDREITNFRRRVFGLETASALLVSVGLIGLGAFFTSLNTKSDRRIINVLGAASMVPYTAGLAGLYTSNKLTNRYDI